ncbi:hypothetical protein Tco_1245895 [Tanacetum coccineum]
MTGIVQIDRVVLRNDSLVYDNEPENDGEELYISDEDHDNIEFHTKGVTSYALEMTQPPLRGRYNVEESHPKDDVIETKYKLWFYKSDSNSLLAYYGRDLDLGSCKGKRDRVKKLKVKDNDKGKEDLIREDRPLHANIPMQTPYIPEIEHLRKTLLECQHKVGEFIDGLGLTVSSDSHKGLIEAMKTWLANAKHSHCCRHIYANFRRKWIARMKEIREVDAKAYAYLMENDPSTWCKALFEPDRHCATLENGISKSFNGKIMAAKVFASDYQVVEVKRRDEAFGVNLIIRSCDCRLWTLIESKWFDTYQFSIKPVYGSKMWKPTINTPPLPPIVKIMRGRPRKNRIKHPSEKEMNILRDKPTTKADKPPRPTNSLVYTTDRNRRGGISINDVSPTKAKIGETNKRGGSFSSCVHIKRGGGSPIRSRGGGSTSRGGRSISRGGNSSKRGENLNKKDQASNKRVGTSNKKSVSATEREVMQNTMLEERRRKEERERNGRINTEWDDLMFNPFSEEELTMDRIATLSELATLDEANVEHNEGLPSNSQDLGSPQGTNGQSSVEILQSIPTIQVMPSQSKERETPRAPRPRTHIRLKDCQRRKFNYPTDGIGMFPTTPFTL